MLWILFIQIFFTIFLRLVYIMHVCGCVLLSSVVCACVLWLPEMTSCVLGHRVDRVGCERWKSCCRAANNCCRRQLSLRTTASPGVMEGLRSPVDDRTERCASTWDGFSCWDSAEAGTEVRQACPPFMDRVITTRQYSRCLHQLAEQHELL